MLDGVLAFVCHGASDHCLVRRLWVDDAWPDVANLVIDFIEPLNSRHMPFLLVHQDGRALTGLERLHCNVGDPAVVVMSRAFQNSPSLWMSLPKLHLLAHLSATPALTSRSNVAWSLSARACWIAAILSIGNLPACVVRIRSVLRFIALSSLLGLPKQLMMEHCDVCRKMRDRPILPLGVLYVKRDERPA